jgi:hypothetical protein
MASTSSSWRFVSTLLAILVLIQWLVLAVILEPDEKCLPAISSHFSPSVRSKDAIQHQHQLLATLVPIARTQQQNQLLLTSNLSIPDSSSGEKAYEGVAVTVMLKAPKWFHRRYTAMLHNVLANLPPTWTIQVFFNEKWLEQDVLPLHPGLQKLRESNKRILWTQIPNEMTRWKPKDIMKSTWIWESIVAENILLFGGNGAFCGNSRVSLDSFLEFDYVGAPWMKYFGRGGDGSSYSFRHRSAMLDIMREHPPDDGNPDYQYFLKHMIKDGSKYKIADRNVTIAFAGASEYTPLLLSGTQAHLNWTAREAALATCPELKMIFPSLHEPTCFGAHPNGEQCKKTVCALNEIPPQGC